MTMKVTRCEFAFGLTCKQVGERMAELETQNARLRKLALDFYDAIDSVFWDGESETKERFKPRMRELGVEVSE